MGQGSSTPTHNMVIVTGDKKGARANNLDVRIRFTDSKGKDQLETVTDCWNNDFGRLCPEYFDLELLDLGKIAAIEIQRNDKNDDDSWYIDRVEVNQLVPGTTSSDKKYLNQSIFPVNRWLEAGTDINIIEFDSCLPQDDPNSDQRRTELRNKREKYMLSGKIIGAPPQVEILPKDETFSAEYMINFGVNGLLSKVDGTILKVTGARFESLEDIEAIYDRDDAFPRPLGLDNWQCDLAFAQQKLSGVNPAIIKLCTKIPDHFEVTADMVKPHLEKKTLSKALSMNRMFIIDLSYLAAIECSNDNTIPGPTALFYQRDTGHLVPVAIQLMPGPKIPDNPVFTPSDPKYTWLAAKLWFNLADCSHHQSATHLGFTHLLMESVAVCANRRLSVSHPIYKLLAPHFLYVMAINSLAMSALVGPGGWVDTAMEIGRQGMFNIIRYEWKRWHLQDNGNLMKDLKNRGVDGKGTLPSYHYRDDATLLWNALNKYVATVVNAAYGEGDEKLKGDYEIHAWRREMTENAEMLGIPELKTKDDLIEVVTVFIYISSVGHAAANFQQYDQYGFPPYYPSLLNVDRPKNKDALGQQYIVDSLPTKRQTVDVMEITKILSQKATNSLGDFEPQG